MSVVTHLIPRRNRAPKQLPPRHRQLSPAEQIEQHLGRTARNDLQFTSVPGAGRQPRFVPAIARETRPQAAATEHRELLAQVLDGLKAWNPPAAPAGVHPFDAAIPADVQAIQERAKADPTYVLPDWLTVPLAPVAPALDPRRAMARDRRELAVFRAVSRFGGWCQVLLPQPEPLPRRHPDAGQWDELVRQFGAEIDAALGEVRSHPGSIVELESLMLAERKRAAEAETERAA